MRDIEISLRWKVALSVSLMLIVVSGAVALTLVRDQWFFLRQEGEKRVQALAANLALTARDSLLVDDDLRLGPIVESVLQDEDAVYAYLVDHEGRVAYHTQGELIGRSYDDQLPRPGSDVLEAVEPIVVEGTRVGTAIVGLGVGFVTEAMRASTLGLLLPLGVGTVAGVAGIILLTGIHIRRIEKLEEAVLALGAGDRRAKASVGGRDEVSRLAAHFNRMVEQLEAARRETEKGFTEAVGALVAAIEAKDTYTRGHCERVAGISLAIARRLGVPELELKDLELAALLHDIGKIGVGGGILGKIGRLSKSEQRSMEQHPEIGARILSSLSFLGRAGSYVRHHHEHYDGSGYPQGLAGEDIPLPSRIIHVVDAYDAMTSSRSYRQELSHREAVSRLMSGKGSQFDPAIVELFLDLDRTGVVDAIRQELELTQAS